MKYIIAGQLMIWGNIVSVIVGFLLYRYLQIESAYVQVIIGGIGALGSIGNLVFATILQVHGYQDLKVIEKSRY